MSGGEDPIEWTPPESGLGRSQEELIEKWGPRDIWTGNNAEVEELRQVHDDHWFASGWSTCRCGRVWKVTAGEATEQLALMTLRLRGTLCRGCRAWLKQGRDECPEHNCRLPYWHTGRCVPIFTNEQHQEMVRRAREASDG